MTMDFEILDQTETNSILPSGGRGSSMTGQIVFALKRVVDTSSSLFVTGMAEPQVNALRIHAKRNGMLLTVNRAVRNDVRGHVVRARSAA